MQPHSTDARLADAALRDVWSRLSARVRRDTQGWHPEARVMALALADEAVRRTRVRELLLRLGTTESSVNSRYYRAGLASPKLLHTIFRLTLVADLHAGRRMMSADVAYLLNASSPQSLGRTVRQFTGTTVGQLRHAFADGDTVWSRLAAPIVQWNHPAWQSFAPLTGTRVQGVYHATAA